MAVVVSIGTLGAEVDKSAFIESFDRERAINTTAIARLIVFDPLGVYRPAERESVLIDIDAVRVFTGTIVRVSMGFWGNGAGCRCTVEAADGNFLMQRIMYNGTIVAGTLKAALQELPLAAGNVTLNAAQVDGDALDALTFPWTRVDAVLNYLSTLTGYIWRVDETNVLTMWAIGAADPAAITFSSGNGNIDIQRDVSWSEDSMPYVNYQILLYGPEGGLTVQDTFTGDGGTMSWALTYPTAAITHPGYVTIDGVQETLATAEHATQWSYGFADAPAGTGGLLMAPTTQAPGPTTGADGIVFDYTAPFPQVVYSQDAADRAAVGDWVGFATAPQITQAVEAQAYCDALRRRYRVIPRVVSVPSLAVEVVPGYTCTATIASLGVSGTYLATASRVSYQRGRLPEYTTDLISGSELPQSWVGWWQSLGAGTGGGGSNAVGGSSGLTGVSTGPVWLSLGGSIDIAGVTGATSGTARDAIPILGAPYDGRTVTPYVTCRVRLAGQTITPIIKDQDNNVISTGTACTSTTAESQGLPAFEMVSGRVYTLRWTLDAAGSTGYLHGYLYAS